MKQSENNTPYYILLVDDEKVIRETLCSILKEDGYEVFMACSGKEAINLAQKHLFDLAILDIKLPDVGGLEVLKDIKKLQPNICAVLITAYPTTESAIMAIQEEAYEYITKPFDISHVKLVIKRGIEEEQLSLENKLLLNNLQSEKEKLEIILQVGHMMSSILNLDKLAEFIVQKISEVLKVRICSLMLLDEEEDMLSIKAAIGLDEVVIRTTKIRLGQSISGWVAQRGEPVLISDIENDMRFGRANMPKYETINRLFYNINDLELWSQHVLRFIGNE